MPRKYQVISADGHLETPPDASVKHVPEKHRDRAPRLTHLSGGRGDAWLVEGQPILHVGSNISGTGTFKFAYASYTTEEGSPTPGTGDAVQRLREQDHDGIDAEVLFPPVHISRFIEGIGDKDVYVSVVQAYNTFLAEDFCSVAPDRLIGAAFMPVSGIRDAVEELERAKRLGLKAVTLRQFPNGTGKAAPEDDQFWERALELGMALSPHINFGDPGPAPTVRHDKLLYPPAAGMGSHVASYLPGYTLAQLIVGGIFDRFPDLQLYFAESNCALLPGMLYYLDRDYVGYNDWYQISLKQKPSEYVLEHCKFGLIEEEPAIKMALAGLMPMDWFMWGSDFPHGMGTFPKW